MSCDSISCRIFAIDFEEDTITFKVPSAVMDRGFKSGHADINFSRIIGDRKTSDTKEDSQNDT